jgi:hypothetical protein
MKKMASLLFPPTGTLELDQPLRRFGEHGALFVFLHFLPRFDFTFAAATAEAYLFVELAEADAGILGAHGVA